MSVPLKNKNTVKTEIDEWGRRKFHLEQGSAEQQLEQKQLIDVGRNKSMLVGREENLNIEKYVGRIEKNMKNKKKEIFYCDVCKEGFKCDLAYITHLNSPQHNRKLGMSMKVMAVSTETVTNKFKAMKAEANPTQPLKHTKNPKQQENNIKIQSKIEQAQENQKEAGKNQQEQEEQNDEDDIEAQLIAMGLPTSFGSKKQKR